MKYKTDSRKVTKGDTFIALKEANHDGHDYINDAIKNGATTVICEKGLCKVETLIVKNTHDYLVKILNEEYQDKLKDMTLIGMTGTNGKTTTCYCLHQMLNKINLKCGYIGTIGFYIKDKIKNLNNTTPDILDIYELLLECYEKKCKYVIMEVSSHALEKKRVDGIKFDYAIFSNLTQDHLDYHKDMKNYALAKQILFKNLKENGIGIVNIDDEYKDYFLINENNITYGISNSDYKINDIELLNDKTNFKIKKDEEITFETKMLGKHNVYNLTVCIILLDKFGIEIEIIKKLILEVTAPPGRMETIDYDSNKIIIDYAHTPDAVEKIINSVKQFCIGKIYTIIGCGGDRDKTKRPKMASISCELSDYVIFTTDNPRTENPKEIINDMLQNLDKNNYEIELNRKYAIIRGIQKLEKNDILLLLGKGHEDYQIIGNEKIHFDDKEVTVDFIRR